VAALLDGLVLGVAGFIVGAILGLDAKFANSVVVPASV
jgi:hypothetical protein